ncbi:MAG: aldose 1-epimerase [Thermoleophilaceae bacterium]|nr:aldose 1-epimerase [Thermoleophilaceae bacterium]
MVQLTAGELEATFAPEVGMVGCSLRHRGQELLGQRGGLEQYQRSGSSFGIPLLHPWANRLEGMRYGQVELDPSRSPIRQDEHGLPIHGLLSASPHWNVLSRGDSRFSARFSFDRPELLCAFPYPHELDVAVTLTAEGLGVSTTLRATGVLPVPVAFGYHPYLSLPGVARENWWVEMPVTERAVLDRQGIPTGAADPVAFEPGPLGERAFDDLFPDIAPGARFVLEGGGRRVEIVFEEGYPVAQVFAPEGQDFICFEPMTAPTNALVTGLGLRRVHPGAEFGARFSIAVAAAGDPPRRAFRQRTEPIGLRVDVTNVAEAIETLDGPAGR